MKTLTLCAAVAAAMLSTGQVRAATIIEDSDFSNNLASPTFVGALDIGAHSISGSVSAVCDKVEDSECTFFGEDNGDAVSFAIPSGAVLALATLFITDLNTTGEGSPSVFARSFSGLGFLGSVGNGTFNVLGSGTPTGLQNYQVALAPFNGAEGDRVSFNWSLNLTVARTEVQVPEPSTLALLGLGLVGMGMRRRIKAS